MCTHMLISFNPFPSMELSENSTEIKKMESFPKSLLPSPPSESLPTHRDNRERLVLMSKRNTFTVEPQGLHLYLQTSAGPLGVSEGSHAPGIPLPITRGRERPGGISTVDAAAAFWVTHSTCGQGRAREMSCLEPTHSASRSPADDGLWVSFATAQNGANSQWVSATAQGLVSFRSVAEVS